MASIKDDREVSHLEKLRHTASHVLAQAVLKYYPDTKLGIGPAIDDGFYYDFEFSEPVTDEILPKLEKEMKRIIKRNLSLTQEFRPRIGVIERYKGLEQEYKLDLLNDIPDEELSFFITGDNEFLDLCRGPHVSSTGEIGAVKLLRIAGAYWRGDEKKKMLTRIYGTAFETEEELEEQLERLKMAEERNHRKLGKQLGIFANIKEIGQGLPVWLPNGFIIRRELEDYMYALERSFGYVHILTPHINKKELFETSGHLEFYKESMYPGIKIEDEEYYLKPMNCPACMMVYKNEMRSYRDLPLKFGEMGTVYRYEQSGELQGLQRVRGFTQNDAHIFCSPDQLEEEFMQVMEMLKIFYGEIGFDNYKFRLSLSDPDDEKFKRCGTREDWEKTEETLRKVLDKHEVNYYEAFGEAAFYGPKLDVQAINIFGKEDTISTIQVDFNLPERFELEYTTNDGGTARPYVIHRALIGSFERFFAFLIEHYGGAFPTWLSPVQVKILPITDDHIEYGRELMNQLKGAGIRVDLDDRSEKLGYKIREAEMQKIPYILVIGEKEKQTGTVSVRVRGMKDQGLHKVVDFINTITEEAKGRVIQPSLGHSEK